MKKILTFSYDDAVSQDIRLIELFNKYGMKATFNLNSGNLGIKGKVTYKGHETTHNKVEAADLRSIYEGHEVASHTVNHPKLPDISSEAEIIRQVEEDRLRLSELCGYEVVGFAYPCGGKNYDSRVSEILRRSTGVKYCRTIETNGSFALQENLYEFKPSVYHLCWDEMFSLGEKFLEAVPEEKQTFYVWGHSYEFDFENTWDRFEQFLKMMSGRSDIAYLTNKEALLF